MKVKLNRVISIQFKQVGEFQLYFVHTKERLSGLIFWKPKRGGRTNILNLLETAPQASSTAGYPGSVSATWTHTVCTLNMTIN